MIDLHLHTQASDGTWSPDQAVAEAARIGLHAIAFADHDSLASVAVGMRAARGRGLRFVIATEITSGASAEESLHILGYGVDPANPRLRSVLACNQEAWRANERSSLINLARLGIVISQLRYDYWAAHREAGGWPTYNCLAELGLVRDHRDYFAKYFGPGCPAHVETAFVPPAEAIAAIKDAGGVAILAHPGAYDPAGRTVLERPGFLDGIVGLGIDGLEAIANENSPEVTEHLLAYCRARGLIITGGSDCHGGFVAGRTLGRPPVPDEHLPPLLARLRPGSHV